MNTTIITRTTNTSTPTPLVKEPPAVVKLGPGRYIAESRSVTLGVHEVDLVEYGWQCNCKGFYWRFDCAHVRAVLAAEAQALALSAAGAPPSAQPAETRGVSEVPEEDIEQDLSDIAEWLREEGNGQISPFYSDGTRKPYDPGDSHMEMVRKAQAFWEWDQ